MPIAPTGSLVLVSGASGYVAVHCCQQLLNAGYDVRGTVRSADKGEYLVRLFAGHDRKFSYTVVRDIQEPHAFDASVEGVSAVLHTASPFYVAAEGADPQELIGPALQGTKELLESCKNSTTIQRIVITSSIAAMTNPETAPYVFHEKNWNDWSVERVAELGHGAEGNHKYKASKSLAERAAWEFVENNKVAWDITTICPPTIFGPILHQVATPEQLNTSVAVFYKAASGGNKASELPKPSGNYCDVREVAAAHILSLQVEKAGGERYLTCAGPFCIQDFTDNLLKHAPHLADRVPKGPEGGVAQANNPAKLLTGDGSKAERDLGLEYRPMEETVRDMYTSLQSRGW